MKKPEMYLETPINDIVFEDRNQAYGAYQLRKNSSRFLSIALLIGIILSTFFTAFSLTNKKPVMNDYAITTSYVVSDFPVYKVPEVKKILPSPPQQEMVKQASAVFAEMVVREDVSKTIDEVPTIESLKDKIIGTENIESPIDGETPIIDNPIMEPAVKKPDYETYVSQMPEYIGGYLAMRNWLSKEISYPEYAVENEIEGTVYVSFIINVDGTISSAQLMSGIGYGCDEEAIRSINKMPRWLPGKQNSTPVRVKITIPIKFELDN